MIIRISLRDNKKTQIIEKYFDDGGPFVVANHNSEEEYEQFKKDLKSFYNYFNRCPERDKLKEKITQTIRGNFINYINNITIDSNWKTEMFNPNDIINNKESILGRLEVRMMTAFLDESKNNEVVYYFDSNRKYITM